LILSVTSSVTQLQNFTNSVLNQAYWLSLTIILYIAIHAKNIEIELFSILLVNSKIKLLTKAYG